MIKKQIMKILILCVLCLFVFNLQAETNSNELVYQEKDPFIAGLLSVTMMGLGHFYTKDYLSGSMFVLNDFIQKGLLILLISNFNDKYADGPNNDKVVKWNEVTDTDKAIVIGFAAYYFGFRLYSIIDAMDSAEKYNQNLRNEFAHNSIKMNYVISSEKVGLGLSRKF
jgi:hypothetical protein